MLSCPECSHDLTLQFRPIGKPALKIGQCPECNTKLIKPDEGKDQLVEYVEKGQKRPSILSPMNGPGVYRENINNGMATKEEMDRELERLGKVECFTCHNLVSLFASYLVKLRITYFPKLIEIITMVSSDGVLYNEERVKYLPPIPIKTRLCKGCFNKFPSSSYVKDDSGIADIEVLPDPKNMVRDGIRNIPLSHTPKFEKEIVEKPIDINDYGCYREDIVAGFDFSKQEVPERSIKFITVATYNGPDRRLNNNPIDHPDRRKQRKRRERIKVQLTVRSKPSHRVRDFREERSNPEVRGFHRSNVERRKFLKKIER